MTHDDIHYMNRAIGLALRAQGKTSPNPLVGCVIVKNKRTIAEGWHKVCGGDHAEVDALKKAGPKAKGAVMYVTLEPCSHCGRTPPCVDAIVRAGIRKVVVAMKDPNPVNNGKSLKILEKKGVDVVCGILEKKSRDMNQPFIKYITTHMPFVVAKTAQTLDGKIATATGDSKWITREAARVSARARRNDFDAILVGVNTVLKDDPGLNAPSKRLKKVVVDSTLKTPLNARIFKGVRPGDVIVATTPRASKTKIVRLQKKGVVVIMTGLKRGQVDLKRLFKELAKKEITSILIEGGARVVSSALKEGLVDRLHIYIAPRIMGDNKALGSFIGWDVRKVKDALKFKIRSVEPIGGDLFVEADIV
ncbi:MAG: bifunctional diaminohydroxyphosphoribosylaminopyrimidine deaminase/5-amino-6-(5-phosphoribosylamino)uracil reductase RibD [Candidatus Omnitrophica bacterium]|nr:bifunctional diaminohydroxyphosphoribosylaminopyrimidine deaminase/5-amino-6-(5-phosphoribosylamino)uracil reductase RibD [Candidatus Omnitrophota bacterium]